MNHGGRGFESAADAALGEATGDPTAAAALLMAASTRTIGAYDKETGEHLGSVPPGGNPMTYLHEGKQYLVVAVGRGGADAELIALALPWAQGISIRGSLLRCCEVMRVGGPISDQPLRSTPSHWLGLSGRGL